MERLLDANLAGNPLSGSIPPELGNMTTLRTFNLENTTITGVFPSELCSNTIPDIDLNVWVNYTYWLEFDVDCKRVSCQCCYCPTAAPSSFPSVSDLPTVMPSTSKPSGSLTPSQLPSMTDSELPTSMPSTATPSGSSMPSLLPSMTSEPSKIENSLPDVFNGGPSSCSAFSSIAETGTALGISKKDDVAETVTLPFPFLWRGENPYFNVTVSTHGVVFPGATEGWSYCCAADRIELSGLYTLPRIAVAHADLGRDGSIYTLDVGDAFVVSWEGAVRYAEGSNDSFDFQVVLYADGNIEMRWGEGNPVNEAFAAGVEDDSSNVTAPVVGAPFYSHFGISFGWPRNQCCMFEASNGGYKQEIVPNG